LLDDGFNVLNQDEIVPFPSNGNQNDFRIAVQEIMSNYVHPNDLMTIIPEEEERKRRGRK
jgi:hypothetical protein